MLLCAVKLLKKYFFVVSMLLYTYYKVYYKVVLEKTLESPLDCKEIKTLNPEGYQS